MRQYLYDFGVIVGGVLAYLRYRFMTGKRNYAFSFEDVFTYVSEKIVKLKSAKVVGTHESLHQIKIEDMDVYWNKDIPYQDIPWLYHEVFDPWSANPSSYANPKLKQASELSWVMDAGASEGFFTLQMAENGFQGKILAIEPIRLLKEGLIRTIEVGKEKAKSAMSFEVVTAALGSSEGLCEMNIDLQSICCSEVAAVQQEGEILVDAVEVTTVDSLVKKHGFSDGGLIKMDIEGFEMEALEGARETIISFKPQLAVAVYHDYNNARDCADIIRSFRDDYTIEFRGMNAYETPPRPFILFAY